MSPQPATDERQGLRLSGRTAAVTTAGQFVTRGLTLLFLLASIAVVTRAIGVIEFADWATVLTVAAMLAFLIDPGIAPVVIRRLAQDPASCPSPGALALARVPVALAAMAAVVAISVALRGLDVLALAAILSGQILARTFVYNAGAWMQADHRLHRQTTFEALCALAGLLALLVAAELGGGPELLAAVGFLTPVVALALLMNRELAITPSRRLIVPGDDRVRVRSLVREVLPLAGSLVLLTIYTRIFVVFINEAEDSAGVAELLLAFSFVEQVIMGAGIVAGAILPLLALRGRTVALLDDRLTHDALVGMCALGLATSAGLLLAAPVLVELIGGADLAGATLPLTLLTPVATAIFASFFIGYLCTTVGLARRFLWINAVVLVFVLVANATLTLRYGTPAAARITWAAEMLLVVIGSAPIWRASRGGRLAAARAVLLLATGVACSELVAADLVPRALAATLAALALLAIGGPPLGRLARRARRRPEPAPG